MTVSPRLKTTELILTVLTDVGVVASALSGVLPAKYAALAATVASTAYAISRGLAKQGVAAATVATNLPSTPKPPVPPAA